jgi:hypothetical protein
MSSSPGAARPNTSPNLSSTKAVAVAEHFFNTLGVLGAPLLIRAQTSALLPSE